MTPSLPISRVQVRTQPPRGRRRAGNPGRDGEEPPRRGAHRTEPDTQRERPEPMNTDPASTRSPHLDLEDLIEEITGQAIGGRAREHIAACERCRAEANRWTLVADGVRGL